MQKSFSRAKGEMKVIGEKCGWVVPQKERRVIKLLRVHTCECDHEFVINSPSVPRRKAGLKIHVEFAPEELSAFEPAVQVAPAKDLAA